MRPTYPGFALALWSGLVLICIGPLAIWSVQTGSWLFAIWSVALLVCVGFVWLDARWIAYPIIGLLAIAVGAAVIEMVVDQTFRWLVAIQAVAAARFSYGLWEWSRGPSASLLRQIDELMIRLEEEEALAAREAEASSGLEVTTARL